jgi:uncharacterized membrane protein YkvA (DUF1232 family)
MKDKNFSDIFNIASKWRSLMRLIKDKSYKIPLVRKILYIISLIYVISPIDFIPELLVPPLGFIDDIGALAFFLMLILYEIDQYEDYLGVGGADADEIGSTRGKSKDEGETIDLNKDDWKES